MLKAKTERRCNERIGSKTVLNGGGEKMMVTCISSHGEKDKMERSTCCFPVKL